jgi:hypothetical protein
MNELDRLVDWIDSYFERRENENDFTLLQGVAIFALIILVGVLSNTVRPYLTEKRFTGNILRLTPRL